MVISLECGSPPGPRHLHGTHGGAGHGLGRHGAQHQHAGVRFNGPRGQSEQGVAIELGMHGVDGAGQAVVAAHGQALRLGFAQARIGGHHADGGVGARQYRLGDSACQQGVQRVAQVVAVFAARTGDGLAGGRIDHIAHGIAGNQCAHSGATDRDRGRANPALHRTGDAEKLAHAGPAARPDIAFCWRCSARRSAGRVACCRIGANAHVAHMQVEQHGGRHDGQAAHAYIEANVLFLQPAHGTGGGFKAPGAAA
jgi:hypothetical protein